MASPAETSETPVIVVDQLTARFGANTIFDRVSFKVNRGEILVILGGSGCGKSTMLKHLIGLYKPATGQVLINGVNINTDDEGILRRVRMDLGVLFQSGALFGSMTLAENVSLPIQEYTDLDGATIELIVRMKLGLVSLAGYENHLPSEISGGMQKRAGLARAMALDPTVLFFDEPSAGLDPITSVELDNLIKSINAGMGTTMVIVTHELESIFNIAHRVIMLDKSARGIIAEGDPRELKDHSTDPRVVNFFNRRPPAGPGPEERNMARQKTNLIIGLFVILGVVMGVVAIIWVGATSYFQKGSAYISYFDESVQGLQLNSAVKFRGVDVGLVESIRVAPDNRNIGVVMKINMKDDLQKNAVAQLKSAGITGIMFVELDLRKPDEASLTPKIDFPSEYPIIASRPSEMQRLVAGVNEIVEKFNKIDAKGISDQLIATTKALEEVIKGKQMTSILARVDAAAGNLDRLTARADKILGEAGLDKTVAEAREALTGARSLLATVNGQILAMKLPATLAEAREIGRELQATSQNLRQSSETLEMLLQRVYERPSDLLFGKPPKKRWNE